MAIRAAGASLAYVSDREGQAQHRNRYQKALSQHVDLLLF
jgi:hypothetical protein